MSAGQRPGKRGLREVLEVGVARDEMRAARETGVVFDVVASHGERFGQCIRTQDGRHVYVEPRQLTGVDVVPPMVVRAQANTACLVAALSDALRDALSS